MQLLLLYIDLQIFRVVYLAIKFAIDTTKNESEKKDFQSYQSRIG